MPMRVLKRLVGDMAPCRRALRSVFPHDMALQTP